MLFVSKYDKQYSNVDEYQHRFEVYKKNVDKVNAHNNYPFKTYTMAINKFADMTEDEFIAKVAAKTPTLPAFRGDVVDPDYQGEIDWKQDDKVVAARDNGGCRASFAFTTTEVLESTHAITYKHSPEPFSV